jgi:RES domain-containing protein
LPSSEATPITKLSLTDLPDGWDAGEPKRATRDIGTEWVKGLTTAILAVPSAAIPREWNYLLNPAHPAFVTFHFSEPEPFYFDDRLGRAWVRKA